MVAANNSVCAVSSTELDSSLCCPLGSRKVGGSPTSRNSSGFDPISPGPKLSGQTVSGRVEPRVGKARLSISVFVQVVIGVTDGGSKSTPISFT